MLASLRKSQQLGLGSRCRYRWLLAGFPVYWPAEHLADISSRTLPILMIPIRRVTCYLDRLHIFDSCGIFNGKKPGGVKVADHPVDSLLVLWSWVH